MSETEENPKIAVHLTFDPIDLIKQLEFVSDPECGAISTFLGVTRNNFQEKTVLYLEYECYDTMAIKKMKEISEEAMKRWPELSKISVVHRLGKVPVKEASISIVVSSPHRKESLLAVQWLIDTLKSLVPIWKKEFYSDGSSWKANSEWIGDKKHCCC